MGATSNIALDHPIDVSGVAIRSLPIRPATLADVNEAKRIRLRKREAGKADLMRAIKPHLKPGESLGDAVEGFALFRCVTGLPFAALVQLEPVDQAKLGEFLAASAKAESHV